MRHPAGLKIISVAAPFSVLLLMNTAPVAAQQNEHTTHGVPPTAVPVTEVPQSPDPHADHTSTQSLQHATDIRASSTSGEYGTMQMSGVQGQTAPADARDPLSYAEGFEYTDMPGGERTDLLRFGLTRADELEALSGNEGDGFAWNVQGSYGNDRNKLWLRTQGLKVPGELDPTTSGEALWWRPLSAFWGTQLGVRQDFGAGPHTYLALGFQGLAPYWIDIETTAYVGADGRLAGRLKAAYDVLFTNRLILTAGLESNLYSRPERARALGAGLGNIEAGLRLRYEFRRKIAPYVGYVWERSFAGTAELRRAAGDPVKEHRTVAGVRLWW